MRSVLVLAAAAGASLSGASDPEPGAVSFARDVRPILAERCVLCHGPDAAVREAELRLDVPEGWTRDLGGHAAVVPGSPAKSELLARVRASERERMPPRAHGPALSAREIAVLEAWIVEGAQYEEHWAYAPLQRPALPGVENADWPRNPLDLFVLARLEASGLAPSPEASRRDLIRRVSFDLTGLPPAPEAVEAFVQDDSAGAYERVVDRLLGSQAYAERWTRAWMDLARYADSHGFTIDGRRSMWPWRDWVLRAIDADLPYDQFTLRQLAGDRLPDRRASDVVATGFHRNTQINQEGGAKDEENRVNAVHDRVATTASVWLGTTLACAQCHDHKFDPIRQRDYYRLFAFFDSTEDGGVTAGPSAYVPGTPEEEAAVRTYEERLAAARAALARAEEDAAAGWSTWQPARTKADNGPELVPQLDGSYRVVGQNAVYTTYALEGPAPAAGVGALRLEALPDLGLPAHGPGRAGGNFVLSGVRVEWRAAAETEWRSAPLGRARADHEQDTRAQGGGRYPAEDVLDADAQSGWAVKPAFGLPHVLVLELAEPVPPGAAALRVALEQGFGDSHALGRLRLRTRAEVPADSAAPDVPPAWSAAWRELEARAAEAPALPSVLVLRERPVPRASHVFVRGSFLDPGEPVEPGLPTALAPLVPRELAAEGRRLDRLDLARWLVHPKNALAHRVTVNRWWQAFFGVGLVATENDFGLRGAAPSHPALLDWLARAFVADGFSRKALHRLIVTSATYRQAVPAHGALAARDPENRLLARQRRLRLDAEAIRDAALAVSGLLQPRFGGPPVQPPQPEGVFAFTQSAKAWVADEGDERYRRSLYTRIWRSSVYPFFTTFDAPVPNVACTRRERSTSPLQALTLANDPMLLEPAAALGERARQEGGDDAGGIRRLFERALGRAPDALEARTLAAQLERERSRRLAGGAEADAAARGAWAALGLVVLNLDEFVTRP